MTKLAVILLCAGLVACNKKKEEEGREPLQPMSAAPATGSAPGPGNAAPGSAAAASPGSAAGTPTGAGAAAAPAGTPGGATTPAPVGCATATALHCDAGQTDGCTGGLTAVHLCVAEGAKAGTPCAEGSALACPTGQVDACTYTPPYASNHICVIVPKPMP